MIITLFQRQITMLKFLPVTPFIVIPRDNLNKVPTQSNASLGVKDAWPVKIQTKRLISQCSQSLVEWEKAESRSTLKNNWKIAPPAVTHKISWHNIFFGITKDSLQITLRLFPTKLKGSDSVSSMRRRRRKYFVEEFYLNNYFIAALISSYEAAFSSLQVRSTTETSTVGTRKDIPVSFPFREGRTLPTAFKVTDTGQTTCFWGKNKGSIL